MENKLSTDAEFWPLYLREHAHPLNRRLHLLGTSIALVLIIAAMVTLDLRYLIGALVSGYGFAWAGHFFVEKNRPATFSYPLWSFISDWRMWLLTLLRRPL